MEEPTEHLFAVRRPRTSHAAPPQATPRRAGNRLPLSVRPDAAPSPPLGDAKIRRRSTSRSKFNEATATFHCDSRSAPSSARPVAGETITVGIRLRPFLPSDRRASKQAGGVSVLINPPSQVVLVDQQSMQADDGRGTPKVSAAASMQSRTFECDFVFDSSDPSSDDYVDQAEIYNRVGSRLVNGAVEGYNCCFCSYGQTGTGKTYTITGDWNSPQHRGLLPRLTMGLFERLDALVASEQLQVKVQVSYIEVYNEQLRDLLAASAHKNAAPGVKEVSLEIRSYPARGVQVENLTKVESATPAEVARLATAGDKARRTANTLMNARSSRSHAIFNFSVELRRRPDGGCRMASVQIADLAGRENEQTSKTEGERFRELTFINRSLFQLTNCIYALGEESEHVPFRNSKLTMLLSESLQRNSRTCFLSTLTPCPFGYEENLVTCRFLASMSRVITLPVVNWRGSDDVTAQVDADLYSLRRAAGPSVPAVVPFAPSSDVHLKPRHPVSLADAWNGKWVLEEANCRSMCQHAGSSLACASEALGRLVDANSNAANHLGRAAKRISDMELAVQEMQAVVHGGFVDSARGGRQHSRGRLGDAGALMLANTMYNLPPLVAQVTPRSAVATMGAVHRKAPAVRVSVDLPPLIFS